MKLFQVRTESAGAVTLVPIQTTFIAMAENAHAATEAVESDPNYRENHQTVKIVKVEELSRPIWKVCNPSIARLLAHKGQFWLNKVSFGAMAVFQ